MDQFVEFFFNCSFWFLTFGPMVLECFIGDGWRSNVFFFIIQIGSVYPLLPKHQFGKGNLKIFKLLLNFFFWLYAQKFGSEYNFFSLWAEEFTPILLLPLWIHYCHLENARFSTFVFVCPALSCKLNRVLKINSFVGYKNKNNSQKISFSAT